MKELNPRGLKKLPGLRQLVSGRTKISIQVSSDPRILTTVRTTLLPSEVGGGALWALVSPV